MSVMKDRRGFVKGIAGLSLFALAGGSEKSKGSSGAIKRDRVNALLLSATTNPGQGRMEHAREAIFDTYGTRRNILLINFASLPDVRDRYEERMQETFSKFDHSFRIRSLHHRNHEEAAIMVRDAEAFFVSGGNTFLLLRELYDRQLVELLRSRVWAGIPYMGSSAGSNIAGEVIGTTNDFPLVDVPTRKSLGVMPAVFNPHHPNPESEPDEFASRQWKIGEYTSYNQDSTVIGVTNPGMLRIRGRDISLVGKEARAFVRRKDRSEIFESKGAKEAPIELEALVN